ncbi:hypothetical protein [Mesorhizobium sp. M0478]|uniref:hypothetical protein n=1 Tax=Mesorhizobium sp. M0478 TaxID=2956947 RepID=UPI003339DBF6
MRSADTDGRQRAGEMPQGGFGGSFGEGGNCPARQPVEQDDGAVFRADAGKALPAGNSPWRTGGAMG